LNKIIWVNNSWFAICSIDKEGNVGDDLAIDSEYDSAIATAVKLIKS
jgi:hypothetical protein